MRKISLRILAVLLAAVLLCPSVCAAGGGTGALRYSNTLRLADGFYFTNEISYNSAGKRVESFTAEVRPDGDVYCIVLSREKLYGGMTASEAVSYAESLGYNVLGAVNTDFFNTANGVALGLEIENGEYRSSPEGGNAMTFSDAGAAFSENVNIGITLSVEKSAASANVQTGTLKPIPIFPTQIRPSGTQGTEETTVTLKHLNKTFTESGGLYLFSSAYADEVTLSKNNTWAVRLRITEGTLKAEGEMKLQVADVYRDTERVPIGEGYLVLASGDFAETEEIFESFAVGASVTLNTACDDENVRNAVWATGCGDILAKDGRLTDESAWDRALFSYHPRTVAGIKVDGTVVFKVIDGRSAAYSNGAKLSEAANDLLSLGCVSVVNMDGGGSSALSLRMPGTSRSTVQNSPAINARRCSTYVIFVTDRASDGKVKNIYLAEDGAMILPGASMNLNYLATDGGYMPVALDGNVTAEAALGKIENGVYTAGDTAGTDTLTLTYGGVAATATVHIISSADTLRVIDTATELAPQLTPMQHNTEVAFSLTGATYLSREVAASGAAVIYGVLGNVGVITEDGIFLADGLPGTSGAVTLTVGETVQEVPVTIAPRILDMKFHWAEEYVRELFTRGIVSGTTDYTYSPNNNIRRGDFLLMLWRAAGKPESSGTAAFDDVKTTDYFAAAVAWAAENGIAQGSGGKFRPLDTITRQDAYTLVYRALKVMGVISETGGSTDADGRLGINTYHDAAEVADYAREAVDRLIALGIIGDDGAKLSPRELLKRDEMAKIIYLALYADG